jgi:hypothetical protein
MKKNKPSGWRERWNKETSKMKWKNVRDTMLLSCKNGELGFHTGSGFDHQSFSLGTLEEYGHCYFNEGVDDVIKYAEDFISQELLKLLDRVRDEVINFPIDNLPDNAIEGRTIYANKQRQLLNKIKKNL